MNRAGLFSISFFCMILLYAIISAAAEQPYRIMNKDPEKFFVKQGSAQCGPAAYYIVFRYYDDHLKRTPFFYDAHGAVLDLDDPGDGPDAGRNKTDDPRSVVMTDKSKISAWIKGGSSSTKWSSLVKGARGLYCKNSDGNYLRYYNRIESYDSLTESDSKGALIKMKNFKERIVPEFIEKNYPVIIHLKRSWPFPGHYVVLIGYDAATEKVYYMDPGKKDRDPVIQSVDLKNFITTSWYRGSAPYLWGKARWGGRWLGFYHQ